MKVSINEKEILNLSETRKNVIKNDINEELFDEDIARRIEYILMHKYQNCMDRLKNEWIPKLKLLGIESIPLNDDMLAEMIFSQPEYKSRKERDIISVSKLN